MAEVFGLPLEWEAEEGYVISPIAAVVVIKAIDSDGEEIHAVVVTPGLTAVEALGMARMAVIHAEENVKQTMYSAD